MKHVERLLGWIYLIAHIFLMRYAVQLLAKSLLANGHTLRDGWESLLYYGIAFVFLLAFLFRYVADNVAELLRHPLDTVRAVLYGFLAYHLLVFLLQWIQGLLSGGALLPSFHAENLTLTSRLNQGVPILVAVLLAPAAEEILFRGVAFGSLHRASRLGAYAASVLLYALCSVWQLFLDGFAWNQLWLLAAYIPAGIILCRCYEMSKNIFGPILLHICLNFITLTISVGY